MSTIAIHAACMAAGVRDGLRTAQFYARDMTQADGGSADPDKRPTVLSRLVAALARMFDMGLTSAADLSLRALSPQWRKLPSPFDLAVRERLALALTNTQATLSSEFTQYFFRAARLVLDQWAERPHLVLEHRIEFVRRNWQRHAQQFQEPMPQTMAQVLIDLVEARPIARSGPLKPNSVFLDSIDINVGVFSTACLALLLAQNGRPMAKIDNDVFLAVVGQLIHTRLAKLSALIDQRNVAGIAEILSDCMAEY